MKDKSEQLPLEFRNLADSIGDFIQYFGFKKIHGRIWANLYISKTPLAAVDLCRRLKVSKTLLSFSVADLLKYDVIQEAGRGDRRTIFYRANPDVSGVIFNVLKNREHALLTKIDDKFAAIATRPESIDETRLAQLGEFIRTAKGAFEALLSLNASPADLTSQFDSISNALKFPREEKPIAKSRTTAKKRKLN